ncbi:MAG: hypothetical protein KME23_14605 [Goleter apudmare HA4340-LM2]|nr:hypothetical protein [Goleter apudmare HA4340-LM2]
MAKKKLLPCSILQLRVLQINSTRLIALLVLVVIVLGAGVDKSSNTALIGISPAIAQRISPSDVWQLVYQQLPDFPQENQYISKETGKVAETNTLVSRLIRYHIYVKERTPNYRLDWKLTLADYLDVNETIYDTTYPGHDTLRQNPIEGDRAAITRLTRRQRDALVQVLTDIFNPKSQNTPNPTTNPGTSTTPRQPQTGGAELLK